jgi:hypothetical protein
VLQRARTHGNARQPRRSLATEARGERIVDGADRMPAPGP